MVYKIFYSPICRVIIYNDNLTIYEAQRVSQRKNTLFQIKFDIIAYDNNAQLLHATESTNIYLPDSAFTLSFVGIINIAEMSRIIAR